MAQNDFVSRLEYIQRKRESKLALMISPRIALMPDGIRQFDDPFLPFGKAVIATTKELVCAYIFDFAAYLVIGAAGAVALERTIALARQDVITILHGPFAGPGYAQLMDELAFGVDALTLADSRHLDHYTQRADRSAFVITGGEPHTFDAPVSSGFYWQDAGELTLMGKDGNVIKLIVIDEAVLTVNPTPDFAERIREKVAEIRSQYT